MPSFGFVPQPKLAVSGEIGFILDSRRDAKAPRRRTLSTFTTPLKLVEVQLCHEPCRSEMRRFQLCDVPNPINMQAYSSVSNEMLVIHVCSPTADELINRNVIFHFVECGYLCNFEQGRPLEIRCC